MVHCLYKCTWLDIRFYEVVSYKISRDQCVTMNRASLEVLSFNDLKKKLMDLGLPVMADREKCIDALADHCERLHAA